MFAMYLSGIVSVVVDCFYSSDLVEVLTCQSYT